MKIGGGLVTYLDTGDENRWPDSGEQDIAREPSQHIAHSPACLHIVQLVAVETQILFPGELRQWSGKGGL